MDYRDWFDRVYPELEQNGLWLKGGELNTVNPEAFFQSSGESSNAAVLRVLFTRLSTYRDTADSFTHLLLYQLAKRTPGIFPDLAFLPPPKDLTLFARDKIPWLLGTQTKRGPLDFDVVAFSNAIVQELLNLPSFLDHSGIPLRKSQRIHRPDLPLIVIGGANALYSSAVTLGDPLVDGVFVGESTVHIRELLLICRLGKERNWNKPALLEALEKVPGFFQPDGQHKTRKSFVPDLDPIEALEEAPVPFVAGRAASGPLQISEGCACFCSFCAESWERKPYRERSVAALHETALRAKAAMGLESIDIFSFNFNMHSGIYDLLWRLVPIFRNIGMMSQRLDLPAHDRAMIEFEHVVGKSGFACGLEGISPKLRRYLHKNLSEEEIRASIEMILKVKSRELKIFLIATGLEELSDFEAFEDFLADLKSIRAEYRSGTRILFSMTPLVRFPWTPLEFEETPSMDRYVQVLERTNRLVRSAGFEFRKSSGVSNAWISQVLVRAYDSRVGCALVQAVRKTGFVYYRELPGSFRDAFEKELVSAGLDPTVLLKGFDFESSQEKPWVRVETGVRREFLWESFLQARECKEKNYCLGREWLETRCLQCGACPTLRHIHDIVTARKERPYSLEQLKARVQTTRKATREQEFRLQVGPAARGIPRSLVGVAVGRALMCAESELAKYYRGYRGAYWDDGDRPVWVIGEDLLKLAWLEPGASLVMNLLADPGRMDRVQAELGLWASFVADPTPNFRPTTLVCESPYVCAPERYLEALGLKHVLRKRPPDVCRYELIPQSVKKGILTGLEVRNLGSGGSVCTLVLGPKFTIGLAHEFMSQAFRALEGPVQPVRTIMRAYAGATKQATTAFGQQRFPYLTSSLQQLKADDADPMHN